MKIKRIINMLFVFAFLNIFFMAKQLHFNLLIKIAGIVFLSTYFLLYNIRPLADKKIKGKWSALLGGRELMITASVLLLVEIAFTIYITLFSKIPVTTAVKIVNPIIAAAALFVLAWNGILRMVILSKQISVTLRILIITMWWVPVFNCFIIFKCTKTVLREYRFYLAKEELNFNRVDSSVCQTKYPVLLVHGIFWRDWQVFNYWGRIPKELSRNGAKIYYGNHQSSAPMEVGAHELKKQILEIIEKEKCDKVNIIAHSKGGLDARFAVSQLGVEEHVASLTTVGAPHRGCAIVDRLLNIIPDGIVRWFSRQYSKLYKKLGDTEPDFYAGVHDLTTEACEKFNSEVINADGVLYQSTASKVSGFWSAGFPLNVGYLFFPKDERENDGFVSVKSAMWGDYLGCASTKKNRGVSHGDTIDLTRENIIGFDVCEYYVGMVKALKDKGL